MKKIFSLIMLCFFLTNYRVIAADGQIFLRHNGKMVQTFQSSELPNAVNAAEEGDTIFLTKGRFYHGSSFSITKSIHIIGAGVDESNYWGENSCVIQGDDISITNQDNGKIHNISFEGVYLTQDLNLRADIENVTFKKCKNGNTIYFVSEKSIENIKFDRCMLNYIQTNNQPGIGNLVAKNCKIEELCGGTGLKETTLLKFINCNISKIGADFNGIFVNSIINSISNGSTSYHSATGILVNTLYHARSGYDPMENVPQQDCWLATETLIPTDNDLNCSLSSTELIGAGRVGLDGTPVGIEGGVNPYSLTIHAPSINIKSSKVDGDTKTVTINVSATAK